MIKLTSTDPKDEGNEQAKKENSSQNILPDNGDDSLVDFKSPESKKLRSTRLPKVTRPIAKAKTKIESNLKVRINNQREKRKKETSQNKRSISKAHPTIESSFFKAKTTKAEENVLDDVKAGVVCPLCFKVCKDEESQALHIKICAIKYKLSTKQVMDVMELQKRQEEERKSLGLLTGPALPEKKKQTPRRTIQPQNEDADLQLGLALSRSLQEIEEINQFDDLDLRRETLELANWNEKEPKVASQLEKFGFASTAKATITTRTRKRKLNEVTVLQTRSEADRNRILTERIAEILMGSDAITQDLEQSTANQALKEQAMLRSSLLKTLHCTTTQLWQASTLLSQQAQFYVNELSDYIVPCGKDLANNSDGQEIAMGSSNSIEQSEDLKSTEKGETFGDQKRFYEMSTTTECVPTGEAIEEESNNRLALDWERALNDSSASDMIINVSNGKRIWAHKLVFYIRCPNILLDVMINEDSNVSSIKEKIDWLDTHYDIALAFLEFIYCGRIEKHKHVIENNGLSKLRNMAWKYRVQDLFEYLRKSEACKKDMNSQSDDCNGKENARKIANALKSPEMNISNEISKNKSPMQNITMHERELVPSFSLMLPETDLEITLRQTQKEITLNQKENSEESVQVRNIGGTPCNNSLHEEITFSNIGMSPDMFDDTDEAASISVRNCTTNEPMEKDKVSDCSQNTLTLQASSPISINSTPKIPSDSPERINDREARNSLLSTPNSSHPNRSKEDRLSLKKQRSNLSLFIEKFQKANNKSDSDTESDASIIHNIEVKRNRNPFNVRQINNSSIYPNLQQDDLAAQSAPTKKIGLDALEYNPSDTDTEPYVHDSPSSFKSNVSAKEVLSDDEILAQLEFDLNLCTQKYSEKQNKVDDKCEAEQDTRKASEVSSIANVTDENVDLSQSETDEEEISMYAKYKKTHLHNSIADYRAMLRKKIDSLDSTHLETTTIDPPKNNSTADLSVIQNHSVTKGIEKTALSDTETECSRVSLLSSERDTPNRLKRKRLSRKRSDLSEKKYRDADSGSETDIFFADSPAQGEIHNSRNNPESPLCMPEGDKSIWEDQVELVNEACSQQANEMINETIRGGLLSPANLTTHKLQSPIWILSSPETSLKEMDNKTDTNDKAKSNQLDDDMNHIFEHEIYLANVRIDDDVISEPPSPLNKSKSDGLIQYSSTNLHSSPESMLFNNGKTEIGLNSSVSRGKDALASERLSVRKLQRKSKSHGNFTVNAKTNSMPNLNCSKCYHERLSGVSLKAARTEHSTTPPPDYQSMDTPKLHKELKKLGLKLQKRKRAVKLLTHIYNELHPVVPAGEENIELRGKCHEIDGNEQLGERLSHNTSNGSNEDNLSQDYSIADMPESDIIIAEERELDEIETVTTQIGSNVKERFLKLIKTDRELYNKVLSYEPLCLETLHALLKADGLKCNKNTLMDFLDEQCITFYVQDNNRREKVRGASNENKRKKASKKT